MSFILIFITVKQQQQSNVSVYGPSSKFSIFKIILDDVNNGGNNSNTHFITMTNYVHVIVVAYQTIGSLRKLLVTFIGPPMRHVA